MAGKTQISIKKNEFNPLTNAFLYGIITYGREIDAKKPAKMLVWLNGRAADL